MLKIKVSAELLAKSIRFPNLIAKMLKTVPKMTDRNPAAHHRVYIEAFSFQNSLASRATFSIENFIKIRDRALKKQPPTVKTIASIVPLVEFLS